MPIGERYKGVQRPIMNDRVGVQDENILSLGGVDSDIVRLAESKVRTVFDDTNLWIILADEFGRSISGTVVGNDDLKLCGARSSIDGTQTLPNRFPIVPADGYDG